MAEEKIILSKPLAEPWRQSARELASSILTGAMSSRQVTESILARIDAVNPTVNALTASSLSDARRSEMLAAADEADRQLELAKNQGQEALARLGPLHGVPISIKVNVDVEGQATDGGIVALKDLIASSDAPVVSRFKEAGAIILARSNAPSFSLRWFTDNDLHGRTLNPWDAQRTPGGSSGGAAAAVALGMGPIAHGNDYGGSVRHPAWACGVVGLRPTAGRVAAVNATAKEDRTLSNQLMSVQGPLTRNVADAGLALEIMAGADARDPLWVPAALSHSDTLLPKKVALFKTDPICQADASVQQALIQAAAALSAAGYPHRASCG